MQEAVAAKRNTLLWTLGSPFHFFLSRPETYFQTRSLSFMFRSLNGPQIYVYISKKGKAA
jgi:hypothetical protein